MGGKGRGSDPDPTFLTRLLSLSLLRCCNFLSVSLFFSPFLCLTGAADVKLKQRAMQLQQMVTMRFQWNFADEDDEDMPQVVDLPPGVVL